MWGGKAPGPLVLGPLDWLAGAGREKDGFLEEGGWSSGSAYSVRGVFIFLISGLISFV